MQRQIITLLRHEQQRKAIELYQRDKKNARTRHTVRHNRPPHLHEPTSIYRTTHMKYSQWRGHGLVGDSAPTYVFWYIFTYSQTLRIKWNPTLSARSPVEKKSNNSRSWDSFRPWWWCVLVRPRRSNYYLRLQNTASGDEESKKKEKKRRKKTDFGASIAI